MIMRMYLRYCERHNFEVDVLETSYAEEAESNQQPLKFRLHMLMELCRWSKEHIDLFESPF